MSRRTILNESYFITGIWPFRFHRNFIYFFTNTDITFFWAMTCTEEKEKHKRRNKTSFLNIRFHFISDSWLGFYSLAS